jgi:hypothetical protein
MASNNTNGVATSAVLHSFLDGSDARCPQIRDVVDRVLGSASEHHIVSTTPNDDLLTMYILPDDISAIYVQLNRALAAFGATHIGSDAITKKSTVGDVRELSYKAGGASCKPT